MRAILAACSETQKRQTRLTADERSSEIGHSKLGDA
jgi:hypothetical protein